ncbi:MAG: ACT domain-containing protein [Candidatus Omnitrophica bacterium]|nr:ACT domain-containing protein [Candidatus Omnitrophota bacterium]
MKAKLAEELLLITQNRVGKLAEISRTIKDNGINIMAISAWAFDDQAFFRIVASDHIKAKEILESIGKVEIKKIVIAEMPDEVGQLLELASRLKDNDIDLNYVYGTTAEVGKPATIIFSSNNDIKALDVIAAKSAI